MSWWRLIYTRLYGFLRKGRIEREMDEELRFYIHMRTQENIRRGLAPDQARSDAERRFGNFEHIKDLCRDVRGGGMLETLWQDIRFGSRMLVKSRTVTLVAVLALASGIGANSAIFSVVNAVLLRPLPYTEPDQLILIQDSLPSVGFPKAGLSEAEFLRLRSEAQALERVTFYNDETFTLTGAAEPERISSGIASADFFSLLGVEIAVGRAFGVEEEPDGQSNVVILSHDFWHRKFAANPHILGQQLTLNGRSYTIIGILPQGFKSPLELQADTRLDLWVPPGYNPSSPNKGSHGLNVIGRLRHGLTLQQAAAEARAIIGRVVNDHPNFYPADGSFQVNLTPLHQEIVGDVRPALLVLFGAVAFVLLIACANVANLLLARSEARHKEVAIRSALGASSGRIVRQLLTESLLLATIGGSLGMLLAWWGVKLLLVLHPDNIPRLLEISLDRRVLGFTLLVSLLTGIVFGLIPALQAVKFDLQSSLKEGGRTSAGKHGRSRLREALVVTEVALSLILLVGAGLLIKSFWRLQQVNTGFRAENLLTMRLFPPASTYPDNRRVASFYESLLERVQALPGVETVAATSALPITGSNMDTMMEIEGRPFDMSGFKLSTDFRIVSPGYFRAMGMQLLRGRFLEEADQEQTLRVVVINETLARNHWPDEDPLGRHIRLLDAPPDQATTPYLTIVGVVADAKNRGLNAETRQEMYLPLRQHAASLGEMGLVRRMALAVRTANEPMSLASAIRQEVWALDRGIPITDVRTMEHILGTAVVQPRFNMILLAVFAVIALGLGAIGIYGVMGYSVAQRTHEIGLRMALGAQRTDVLKLVIGQGMRLALIGVITGLAAALALTRLMSSLLFSVEATDPATFIFVASVLAGVALLACYIPARRATRVDPMIALRNE